MLSRRAPTSWFFVKGNETVWIVRTDEHSLLVCGPGQTREHHRFDGEKDMNGFHMWLADDLISDGWILWGVDRDRRHHEDRRLVRRDTPDRRRDP